MKPYFQLVEGIDLQRLEKQETGPMPGVGDCWRAAIGCVLEINPEDVPHFCELARDEWWPATLAWLHKHGLTLIEYDLDDDKAYVPPAFVVLSGPSPRGDWTHSVVGRGNSEGYAEVVHDPHPSEQGLGEGKWRCAAFIALDPSKVAAR